MAVLIERLAHFAMNASVPHLNFRALRTFSANRIAITMGAVALYGCATPPPPPTPNARLPPSIQVSSANVLQEVMQTSQGDQLYICRRLPDPLGTARMPNPGADNAPLKWVVVGSAARLVDARGKDIGTLAPPQHFFAKDGSYVIGTLFAGTGVTPDALPWERYTVKFIATPRHGVGRFANISQIQRIDTVGGVPASPLCAVEGSHLSVPFKATFVFYDALTSIPLSSTMAPIP